MFIPMESKRHILERGQTRTVTQIHKTDPILFAALRFFLYCLVMAGILLCMVWDVRHSPRELLFSEHSLLEYMQEGILLLISVLCVLIGRFDKNNGPLAHLLGGAAIIAFIRELDFFFDEYLFDGAWQLLVSIAFCIIFLKLYPLRNKLRANINDFITRPSFGIIVSGFMTVFVFSRLFGWKGVWQAIMEEHYIRVVKNAAEEGTELLGFLLILIGAVELFLEIVIKKPQCREEDETGFMGSSLS